MLGYGPQGKEGTGTLHLLVVQPVSLEDAGQSRSDPSETFSKIVEGLIQNITVLHQDLRWWQCQEGVLGGPGTNRDESVPVSVLKAGWGIQWQHGPHFLLVHGDEDCHEGKDRRCLHCHSGATSPLAHADTRRHV